MLTAHVDIQCRHGYKKTLHLKGSPLFLMPTGVPWGSWKQAPPLFLMTIWLLRVPLLKTSMSKEWSHVGSLGFFTPALTGSVLLHATNRGGEECGEEAPLRFFSPVGSIIRDASKQGTQRTWGPSVSCSWTCKVGSGAPSFLICVPYGRTEPVTFGLPNDTGALGLDSIWIHEFLASFECDVSFWFSCFFVDDQS